MATKNAISFDDKALVPMQVMVTACGVSEMTLFNWRRGTTRPKCPQTIKKAGDRHRVMIPVNRFLKWADKEGIEVDAKVLHKHLKEAAH